MKAIVINENGGPEKIIFTEVDTPGPGLGQLQVAVETAYARWRTPARSAATAPNSTPMLSA
jgi:hypothetical protein